MKQLVGKTIKEVLISEDQYYMTFKTDDGDINYHVTGDCCSNSYFSETLGIKGLIGEKVKEVEELELGEGDPKPDEDVIALYGIKIRHGSGITLITFRNDSNGYYGGSCDLVTSVQKETVMKKLNKDFSS